MLRKGCIEVMRRKRVEEWERGRELRGLAASLECRASASSSGMGGYLGLARYERPGDNAFLQLRVPVFVIETFEKQKIFLKLDREVLLRNST